MNKAKKVLFNGKDMVRKTDSVIYGNEYSWKNAFSFTDELKITRLGWQNSGCYIELENLEGNKLYMSHQEFNKLLENKDVKISGTFEFLKQGTIQSLGLVKEDK